ncbi:hypothetical protein [Anaerosporobacter sp.]
MTLLSNRYAIVYSHKGYDICTLKAACPTRGDSMAYVIDSVEFQGQEFNDVTDAIVAINTKKEKYGGQVL